MVDKIRQLVRPFISVSLVSTVVYLAVTGIVDAKEVLTLAGLIIAFHFGERSVKKNQ
jgi:hypothetical protein